MKSPHPNAVRWTSADASVSGAQTQSKARRAHYLPPRAIIVDDDALLRESVALVLSGLCETIGLSSGFELEEFLENTHADLLILDVNMPGSDGFELCHRLRQDPRWRSLPVLFLTGRKGEIAYERFLAVQGDAYLTKPFRRDELLETVVRLIPPEESAQ